MFASLVFGARRPHLTNGLFRTNSEERHPTSGGIRIAELARTGSVPDAMVGATPRVLPTETHTNRYGCHARVRDARELGVPGTRRRNRKGVIVEDPVPYCPVVIRPTVGEIGNARRLWLRWWGALLELGGTFQSCGGLTAFELTDDMPPRKPWEVERAKSGLSDVR